MTIVQESAAWLAGGVFRGVALALATATFVIGLVSPLTPSEGDLRPVDLVLFIGVPLALTLWAGLSARTQGWRVAGLGFALLIAAVAVWLFGTVL